MPDRSDLERRLRAGCDELGLTLLRESYTRLLDYLRLLHHWNKTFNLTAIRDPAAMVVQHLLDSLTLVPYIDAQPCLDVGTGAGLPGLVLALVRPEQSWVLLDSNGKKTRFLTHVCNELNVTNVQVVQARVESYRSEHSFAIITARAVSSLSDLVEVSGHLLQPGGVVLAMKGLYPEHELAALPGSRFTIQAHPLHVPGLNAQRFLIAVRRVPPAVPM